MGFLDSLDDDQKPFLYKLDKLDIKDRKAVMNLDNMYSNNIRGVIKQTILQIKNGELKVGDTVFWYDQQEFVTIMKLPSIDPLFKRYIKGNNAFVGSDQTTLVRISTGETREVSSVSSMWKWWNGNIKDEEINKQKMKRLTNKDKVNLRELIEIMFSKTDIDLGKPENVKIMDDGIVKFDIKYPFAIDAKHQIYRDEMNLVYEENIKTCIPNVRSVNIKWIG